MSKDKDIHIHMQNGVVPTEEGNKTIEEFVIWQNKKLSENLEKISTDLQVLNNERDELQRENDKYASSVRYTKGILKNFVELKNLEAELKTEYKLLVDNRQTSLKNFIASSAVHITVYSWVCFMFLYMLYYYGYFIDNFSIYATIFIIFGVVTPVTRVDLIIERKWLKHMIDIPDGTNRRIKEIEETIKKLNSTHDFINEYIDII